MTRWVRVRIPGGEYVWEKHKSEWFYNTKKKEKPANEDDLTHIPTSQELRNFKRNKMFLQEVRIFLEMYGGNYRIEYPYSHFYYPTSMFKGNVEYDLDKHGFLSAFIAFKQYT